MRHSQFSIGLKFYTLSGEWRCTDVGQRTILAIRVDKGTVVTMNHGMASRRETNYDGNDSTWLSGPPYAVAEIVFDETDFDGCSLMDIREEIDVAEVE